MTQGNHAFRLADSLLDRTRFQCSQIHFAQRLRKCTAPYTCRPDLANSPVSITEGFCLYLRLTAIESCDGSLGVCVTEQKLLPYEPCRLCDISKVWGAILLLQYHLSWWRYKRAVCQPMHHQVEKQVQVAHPPPKLKYQVYSKELTTRVFA